MTDKEEIIMLLNKDIEKTREYYRFTQRTFRNLLILNTASFSVMWILYCIHIFS